MTDLARWVAGLTDAECERVVDACIADQLSVDATAFRAALLALVPNEDTLSGPWNVQACHDGMGDFWCVSAAARDESHVFECEAEALAVRDALNALPPSPGATP